MREPEIGRVSRGRPVSSERQPSVALPSAVLRTARGTSAEHHGGHFQRRREKT
jgi:hypothetical protein